MNNYPKLEYICLDSCYSSNKINDCLNICNEKLIKGLEYINKIDK